jgi:hypothetical protein
MLLKNHSFRALFTLLQILIFHSCSIKIISLPDWFQNPQMNLEENQHAYVGMGKEPIDALANALVSLGISKNGIIETSSTRYEQIGSNRMDQYSSTSNLSSQCLVGDIRIEVSSKRAQEENLDLTELDFFERSFSITWLSDGETLFFYDSYYEELSDKEKNRQDQYTGDADLQIIAKYLEELNILTEIFVDEKLSYVRLITSK